MSTNVYARMAWWSILFLFFFQMLADFMESVYAFGLLSTGPVMEMLAILFLLSPALLVVFRRGLPTWTIELLVFAVLVCRVLEPMSDTRSKMYLTGIGTACFLLVFPLLLWRFGRSGISREVQSISMGMLGALALSVFFGTLGSGVDISSWSHYQAIGWGLALTAGLLTRGAFRDNLNQTDETATGNHDAIWRVLSSSIGIMGIFVLMYFAFMSPNVVARWTGANYTLIVVLMFLSISAFVLKMRSRNLLLLMTRPTLLVAANIFFVGSMALTLYLHQVPLPDDTTLYPIYAPPTPLLASITLVLMLLTSSVLLLDFHLFLQNICSSKPSFRTLAASLFVATIFLAAMIFAQILTTVYDYIPVIGPFFRDRFWTVFLVAGLAAAVPTLAIRQPTPAPKETWNGKVATALSAFLLLLGIATVAASFLVAARPATPANTKNALTVLTYNIQQGYSRSGSRSFDEQLDVIRAVDPDIVGLQETDTNRIAGGNKDLIRYYADKLDMYSYYGPSPVTGTFGIALLSKYPIHNPQSFFLYSHSPGSHQKEQTAAIRAEITIGSKTFTVVVTHLGNSGLAVQQASVLKSVEGRENVVAMGDFNSRPGDEGYSLAVQTLDDAWLLAAKDDSTAREVDAQHRIDHIFVSRGTNVQECRYLLGPQSDHPAQLAKIIW